MVGGLIQPDSMLSSMLSSLSVNLEILSTLTLEFTRNEPNLLGHGHLAAKAY